MTFAWWRREYGCRVMFSCSNTKCSTCACTSNLTDFRERRIIGKLLRNQMSAVHCSALACNLCPKTIVFLLDFSYLELENWQNTCRHYHRSFSRNRSSGQTSHPNVLQIWHCFYSNRLRSATAGFWPGEGRGINNENLIRFLLLCQQLVNDIPRIAIEIWKTL